MHFERKSKQKQYQITAFIFDRKGRLLSTGFNSYVKTHPMMFKLGIKVGIKHKIFLHAEVHAITRCRDIAKAYKMLVVRYNEDGTPGNAKPCPICQEAIRQTPIKIIEHT